MDEKKIQEMGFEITEKKGPSRFASTPEAPVIYTNSISVRSSIHDIMLYLGVADPVQPDDVAIRTIARVIMSPPHAKALSIILAKNIQLYEDTFGPIPTERRLDAPKDDLAEDAPKTEG